MNARQRAADSKLLSRVSRIFKTIEETVFSNEIAWAGRFSLILNCVLYPAIVFFIASPMFGRSWTLQDPNVSSFNFIPGLDVVRFELLQNANILWSSLRNFGTPILANEVQAAPLFPLTLGLIWLPEPYFWNALVTLRLLLLAMGTYLVGLRILKCERLGAIVFTLLFAYSVYVCRWINHPWQNGLLAGVWMIYFSGRAIVFSP